MHFGSLCYSYYHEHVQWTENPNTPSHSLPSPPALMSQPVFLLRIHMCDLRDRGQKALRARHTYDSQYPREKDSREATFSHSSKVGPLGPYLHSTRCPRESFYVNSLSYANWLTMCVASPNTLTYPVTLPSGVVTRVVALEANRRDKAQRLHGFRSIC